MLVYKIFRAGEFAAFKVAGVSAGAPVDLAERLHPSLHRRAGAGDPREAFAGESGLVMVAVDTDRLGPRPRLGALARRRPLSPSLPLRSAPTTRSGPPRSRFRAAATSCPLHRYEPRRARRPRRSAPLDPERAHESVAEGAAHRAPAASPGRSRRRAPPAPPRGASGARSRRRRAGPGAPRPPPSCGLLTPSGPPGSASPARPPPPPPPAGPPPPPRARPCASAPPAPLPRPRPLASRARSRHPPAPHAPPAPARPPPRPRRSIAPTGIAPARGRWRISSP